MTAHAQLSPSKRHRWALCPGSIREEAKYPEGNRTSPAAIDGTHSHTLLEWCIKNNLGDPASMVGVTMKDHDGEFKVDVDRTKRVNVALDYLREYKAKNPSAEIISEKRVNPEWLTQRADMHGTVDVQIHDFQNRVVELIDYKDGINDAWESAVMQMEQYAVGVLAAFKLAVNQVYPFDTIVMTVIQPKLALKGGEAIRSVKITVEYALTILLQKLATEAWRVESHNSALVPGELQCKYCRAKATCPALVGQVMEKAGVTFPNMNQPAEVAPQASQGIDVQLANNDVTIVTDERLAEMLDAAPLMRQMLSALDEEVLRRLKAGKKVKGYKLVHGRGSRAWSLPEDQMEDKLAKMGIPRGDIHTKKLISPAQAEKITWVNRAGETNQLSQRQIERMNKDYVVNMAGKITVAPESDPRPAITVDASELFQAVQQPESLPPFMMAPAPAPAPAAEIPDWMR